MAPVVPDEVSYLAIRIAATKGPLFITGGGSRAGYGAPVIGAQLLETDSLVGVGAYEPSELYVRVAAGTPLADLNATLAAEHQCLAAEPPCPAGGTVGGAHACGISGPSTPGLGRLRDHILGCQIIDGRGTVLNFGGTLIKNVAGYDVTRLMVGALGTLGLLTELTLRVRGLPEVVTTVSRECSAPEAIQHANEAVARGLPVTASAWARGVLRLRLVGSAAAVRRALHDLAGDEITKADEEYWIPLRDGADQLFTAAQRIWMCQVPPLTELPFDDHGLIEWHGARRWYFDDAPADIRKVVAAAGGSAVLYRQPTTDAVTDVFPAPSPVVRNFHERLKRTFDPRGILNPGRLGFI